MISAKIALATLFHFGQVFAFSRLINKNAICYDSLLLKEHALRTQGGG